jgi:hypothetical protein
LLFGSLALGPVTSALLWPYLTSKASVGFVLTTQGATTALLVWLIYKMWQGRNWARITFLVLTVLGLPFYVLTLKGYFSASATAGCLNLVQTALQLVALYLIFVRPGSEWFKLRVAVP